MATPFSNNAPQIGQWVLYNNSGTTVPAIVYSAVASTWVVSIVYFNASGATSQTSVSYDPAFGSGKWGWPPYF